MCWILGMMALLNRINPLENLTAGPWSLSRPPCFLRARSSSPGPGATMISSSGEQFQPHHRSKPASWQQKNRAQNQAGIPGPGMIALCLLAYGSVSGSVKLLGMSWWRARSRSGTRGLARQATGGLWRLSKICGHRPAFEQNLPNAMKGSFDSRG